MNYTFFTERWTEIKGYEGLYLISDHGRIKSLPKLIEYSNGRIHHYDEKILKLNFSNGYRTISLVKEKQKVTHMAHILVGLHYVPNPENKPFLNHLDGDRSNSYYLNLEWSTNSENQLHAYNILGRKAVRGEQNGIAKLRETDIPLIRSLRNDGMIIREIAQVFGVSFEAIRKVLTGKSWGWVTASPSIDGKQECYTPGHELQ